MYKGQKITVIIPCLNEEQGIESVLRRMPDFVDEVIVVDNGSTDRTSEVAASFGDERTYAQSELGMREISWAKYLLEHIEAMRDDKPRRNGFALNEWALGS